MNIMTSTASSSIAIVKKKNGELAASARKDANVQFTINLRPGISRPIIKRRGASFIFCLTLVLAAFGYLKCTMHLLSCINININDVLFSSNHSKILATASTANFLFPL